MNVDAATWSFLALLTVIAANRLLLPALGGRAGAWFYWPIQSLDLAGAAFLVGWGMPGLPSALRIMDFFVAGVLVLHILENHLRRSRPHRTPANPPPPAA